MNAPTPKQVRLLYEVACFSETHGRPPTPSELGRMLGVTRQAAHQRAHYAGKKGLHVNLVLTESGRAAVNPLLGG